MPHKNRSSASPLAIPDPSEDVSQVLTVHKVLYSEDLSIADRVQGFGGRGVTDDDAPHLKVEPLLLSLELLHPLVSHIAVTIRGEDDVRLQEAGSVVLFLQESHGNVEGIHEAGATAEEELGKVNDRLRVDVL